MVLVELLPAKVHAGHRVVRRQWSLLITLVLRVLSSMPIVASAVWSALLLPSSAVVNAIAIAGPTRAALLRIDRSCISLAMRPCLCP